MELFVQGEGGWGGVGGDECSGGSRALLTDTSMLTLDRLENISQLSISSSFPFVKPKIHSVILTFFTRCRGFFLFFEIIILSCPSPFFFFF